MRRALAAWLILSSCLPTAVAQKVDADEVLAALRATIQQNTTLEPAARKYVTDHLLSECTNTVFVSGTRLQNERHRSLQEIKALDEQWINTETEIPLQRQVRENECARELLRLLEKKTAVVEAFVMDNQGALVGANQLTSDYWQGDEDKWQQRSTGPPTPCSSRSRCRSWTRQAP
jgi:chromosome condensin MukBEF ATPase and DNA-binding subunit MukB